MMFPNLVNFSSSYLALLSLLAFLLLRSLRKKDKPLPPTPPSDPFIGHARFIPLEYAWKTFADWKKKYGELTSTQGSTQSCSFVYRTTRRPCLHPCTRKSDGSYQLSKCSTGSTGQTERELFRPTQDVRLG